MKYTITETLLILKPNAAWAIHGDHYSDIEWLDKIQTKPTEEEVNQKLKELQIAEPFRLLREERNRRLAECDWTQYRDVSLSNDADWKTYRQELRDLPSKSTPKLDEYGILDVSSVTWPTKPSS